ncbi:MAG: hypothetical protein ABI395_11575 [Sphingobium sp.]
MRNLAFLLAITALVPSQAFAAKAPDPDIKDPPQRVFALVVYGDDPCPKGEGDEIIVCARKPEAERYRIPKPLRDKPKPSGGPGWASQVADMEAAGRAVQPNSCSVNGSYGYTGCTAAMLHQWYAERQMDKAANKP